MAILVFEELIGEIGCRKGYQVIENFGDGADGGVVVRSRNAGLLRKFELQ